MTNKSLRSTAYCFSFLVSMRNDTCSLNTFYVQGYVCTEGDSKYVQIKVATAIE